MLITLAELTGTGENWSTDESVAECTRKRKELGSCPVEIVRVESDSEGEDNRTATRQATWIAALTKAASDYGAISPSPSVVRNEWGGSGRHCKLSAKTDKQRGRPLKNPATLNMSAFNTPKMRGRPRKTISAEIPSNDLCRTCCDKMGVVVVVLGQNLNKKIVRIELVKMKLGGGGRSGKQTRGQPRKKTA